MWACLQREDKYSFAALKRSLVKESNKSKRLRLFLAIASAQAREICAYGNLWKLNFRVLGEKFDAIVWDSCSKGWGKADVSVWVHVWNRKAYEWRGVREIPGEPGRRREGEGDNKEAGFRLEVGTRRTLNAYLRRCFASSPCRPYIATICGFRMWNA